MAKQPIWRLFLRIFMRGAGVILLSGLAGATLIRFAPGLETDERMTDYRLSRESVEALRKERGFSKNPILYYGDYLAEMARGNAGRSIVFGKPVNTLLRERAATTLITVTAGLAIGWLAGVLSAIAAAVTRSAAATLAFTLAGSSLVSIPGAVLATFCALFRLPPAIAIAALVFPRVYAHAFGQLRAAMTLPHVAAARARGLGPLRTFAFHIAPPVLWPMIALAGVTVSIALGSSIPVEALADSPGIGQLAWRAALGRDLAVLVPVTLLMTTAVVAANGAAEVASVWLRRGSA